MFSPKRASRKASNATTTPKKSSIKNEVSQQAKFSPTKKSAKKSDSQLKTINLSKEESLPPPPPSETVLASASESASSPDSVSIVQKVYHQKVNYKTKGETELNEAEVKLIRIIEDEYIIPGDFELDKIKFGPLSDSYYEQRLISCYNRDKLQLKNNNINSNNNESLRKLCLFCAKSDHKTRYCPLRSIS